MNDADINSFANRLHSGNITPKELAVLPIEEFRKILVYLEQRRQMYMQQYINAIFAARTNLAPDDLSGGNTYWESDILAELEMSELN